MMHAFPTLVHVFKYTKTKLNPMIKSANLVPDPRKPTKKISCIEAKIDRGSESSNSLQYKQFEHANWVSIESTGMDADRLRGGTLDALFYDECFPYDQNICIKNGKMKIGKLYDFFINNRELPKVLTYNEDQDTFEYKRILNVWKRGKRKLVEIICENRKIKCTSNHKFLTTGGWKKAIEIQAGELIKTWNNKFHNHGLISVKSVSPVEDIQCVYDIEVEDNHNFIITSVRRSKNLGGLIAHNCQDIPKEAIANANKLLTVSPYGHRGIKVYFGTPKQRGSEYFNMWEKSNKQYYHLGCEKCGKLFQLYTPGSEDWTKIWIYGMIVRCPHCEHTQNKLEAAERGQWVATRPNEESEFVGYHINQLYSPWLNWDDIDSERPENSTVNTERAWQNEVLGEFYAGEMGPITQEEILEHCADKRFMRSSIAREEGKKVFAGFDWGKKNSDDGESVGGQSYSTAVVLTEDGPNRLLIDFATILRKNDNQYKRDVIHEVMRKYSVTQAVGDIGYAHELTEDMQREYGERFLSSRLCNNVAGYIKMSNQDFPKEILAEREYHLHELFNIMKRGLIRFPLKNDKAFEQISWLIEQCCSMEVKITFNVVNEPVRRFVKGAKPNDGLMALLNAYLAYKYYITGGFNNSKASIVEKTGPRKIMAITGYCPQF